MVAVGKVDAQPATEDVVLPDLMKYVYFISTKYCRYRIFKDKVLCTLIVHIKFRRDNFLGKRKF